MDRADVPPTEEGRLTVPIDQKKIEKWKVLEASAYGLRWMVRPAGRPDRTEFISVVGERCHDCDECEHGGACIEWPHIVDAESGYLPPDLATAEFIAAAREAVPMLLAEREELIALLRRIEYVETGDNNVCPVCEEHFDDLRNYPHKPDCKLAAFLGRK